MKDRIANAAQKWVDRIEEERARTALVLAKADKVDEAAGKTLAEIDESREERRRARLGS